MMNDKYPHAANSRELLGGLGLAPVDAEELGHVELGVRDVDAVQPVEHFSVLESLAGQ